MQFGYVPCFGHSLNLGGKVPAECCQEAFSFPFIFVSQCMCSSQYLHIALQILDLLKSAESDPVSVPKRISTTRWSCRVDAVNALIQESHHPIHEAFAKIASDENEAPKVRYEATELHDKMYQLETAI